MDTVTEDNQTVRKADSKGRISGFRPGALYWIDEGSGTVKLTSVVRQWDIRMPISEEAHAYLEEFGIDPNRACADGHDATGYFRFMLDEDGNRILAAGRHAAKEWVEWPENFDYDEFKDRANR